MDGRLEGAGRAVGFALATGAVIALYTMRLTFRPVGLTARDRAAALAVLENAQWVYALGRYPRKQVLGDALDVRMLRERVEAMRKAAGQLSAAQKTKVAVPWDKVEAQGDGTPDALWGMVKKVTPILIAELRPLVSDTPEAAFLISPEPKRTKARKKAPVPRKRKK